MTQIPNAYGQPGVIALDIERAAETYGEAREGQVGIEITTSMCETFLSLEGVDALIVALTEVRTVAAALIGAGSAPDIPPGGRRHGR